VRTQHVDYAIHARKYSREETGLGGEAGHTDKARFIFHIFSTAFLFGKHEGRTLVVEFLTMGFMLRFRLMDPPAKASPICGAYAEYDPPGCGLLPGHGGNHMPAMPRHGTVEYDPRGNKEIA